MKNLDTLNKQKAEILQQINEAVKNNDEEAFAQAFTDFAKVIEEGVMAEARGLIQANDNSILMGRGVRILTSEEKKYYEKVMDAMRSKDPMQALNLIDETLPKTVIDAVFEDITEEHPLLDAIDFQPTGVLTEIIYSVLDGRFMAKWGKLTDQITEELMSGFHVIDLTQMKLSAFIPVSKPMLEIGPEWLDRYVRAILAESIANGAEYGIIAGTGVDEPIGMMKDPNGLFDQANGYPDLPAIPLLEITPLTYGNLLSQLATGPNGLARTITEVLFIVNPIDYFQKVMPATSYRTPNGGWINNIFPFPTKVIQSVHIPQGQALLGIGKRYFFGLGTGKGGKIEYSDHYRFLEDERVYATKLYGNGRPKDGVSFLLLDISVLMPFVPKVFVTNPVVNANVINNTLPVDVIDDPLAVQNADDARIAGLTISGAALSPTFNKDVHTYTATTSSETGTILVMPKDGEATVQILNGSTPVENGAAATWQEGANTLTINITDGTETATYIITVTYTPEG